MMYSMRPSVAISPTNTKKKERTRNVSWLWVGSSLCMCRSRSRSHPESLRRFPSMRPNTRAVRAPDSPKVCARKNRTNSIPRVSM